MLHHLSSPAHVCCRCRGGGGRGGALEFETDRPSEGLDYDGDGAPASFFEEEDIELSDEEGEAPRG